MGTESCSRSDVHPAHPWVTTRGGYPPVPRDVWCPGIP